MSCNSTVDDTIRRLRAWFRASGDAARCASLCEARQSRSICLRTRIRCPQTSLSSPPSARSKTNSFLNSMLGAGTGGRRWLGTLLIADIIAAQKSCDDAVASSSRFPTWISESSTRHCPVLTLYRAPVGFRKQSFAFQVWPPLKNSDK